MVTLAEHRVALAAALSEQEKTRMLAQSSAPFAAEPPSTASTLLRPTSPRPLVFLIVAVVLEFGLGILAALGVSRMR